MRRRWFMRTHFQSIRHPFRRVIHSTLQVYDIPISLSILILQCATLFEPQEPRGDVLLLAFRDGGGESEMNNVDDGHCCFGLLRRILSDGIGQRRGDDGLTTRFDGGAAERGRTSSRHSSRFEQ